MKQSIKLFAILAALAAGSASAAGTLAGTQIKNTAYADFTDPTGVAQPTATSNEVITTVNQVPSFTVLLNGANSTGTPGTAGFVPAGTATLRPGDTASFQYTLTNTGNVADTYALNAQASFGSPAPFNVLYYPQSADTNSDGVLSNNEIAAATAITTLGSVPADDPTTAGNDGSVVKFFVTYTVPPASADAAKVGSDPNVVGVKATTPDTDNYNQVTVTRVDGGLVGPYKDFNANGIVDGSGTPGTPVTPYTTTENRQVTYAGDIQTAGALYNTAAQTITFSHTLQNTGNRPDVFNLVVPTSAELDAAGFPTGTTVTLLKTDGTALTDTNGDTTLDSGTIAPGGSFDFKVRVNLPAGATPVSPATIPSVLIKMLSVNAGASAAAPTDTTVDKLNLAGLQFGDATTALGTTPTPAVQQQGNPGTSVQFPMDVYNAGNLPDNYNLSGSVQIPLTDGTTATVPVKYYLADAGGNPTGAEITNTGSVAAGSELKIVGVVAIPALAASSPSGGLLLTQTATSPLTSISLQDANDSVRVGSTGALDLKKFVTNCGPTGTCAAAPLFTDTPANAAANPGDVLRYTIIAKNNTNNVVKSLVIKDAALANTTFVSVAGSSSAAGTIYYRVNTVNSTTGAIVTTGTWTTTAPTGLVTTATTKQTIEVAVDSNASGGIDANDSIPAGGTLNMDFRVRLN